ncbi:MAG TPA: peptidylprolyl isomerase, partial [Bryobacteraceae bacterium]|nr:peptidylprolyl isomerase [Bryobacteraceae bacterium]
MKSTLFLIFSAAVWAQSAPPASVPDLPPDTVIATYGDNQKLTAGELKSFVAAMPPNMQQNALRDRKAFVQQFVMMHRLSEMAEKGKLDQRSPTKESLSFNRMYILMNAQLHEVLEGISIPQTEAQGFYNQSKNRFKQVKVKAIYIRYSSDAADAAKEPKPLTEAEAQIKIAGLRAALLRGEDFVKLVKENSEDQTSAARDGDFGTMRSTDNLPDAIRNGIFALKAGEVSSPVKQPNGFYLFRAEEINAQPFTEVQEEIVNELRQTHFKKWMDDITGGLNLKIQDESF